MLSDVHFVRNTLGILPRGVASVCKHVTVIRNAKNWIGWNINSIVAVDLLYAYQIQYYEVLVVGGYVSRWGT